MFLFNLMKRNASRHLYCYTTECNMRLECIAEIRHFLCKTVPCFWLKSHFFWSQSLLMMYTHLLTYLSNAQYFHFLIVVGRVFSWRDGDVLRAQPNRFCFQGKKGILIYEKWLALLSSYIKPKSDCCRIIIMWYPFGNM